ADAACAGHFDCHEALPPVLEQPGGGSDQDTPVRGFPDRGARRSRQPLFRSKALELLAVKTEYAILRSDPKESGVVLEQASDHEVGQPLLAAVVMKAVLLGA